MCTYETANSVLQKILTLNDEQKALSCCMLWRSWLRRNKINASGKTMSLEELMGQIRHWTRESLDACRAREQTADRQEQAKWQPPGEDLIKVNINGAYNANSGRDGWGFAACDEDGAIQGSGMGVIQRATSALQAEATTCDEALQTAALWGMGRIILETDSQILARVLESTEFDVQMKESSFVIYVLSLG
ncbi:hypothetical protein D1007_60673 [Hordeum vulgare]|nr:hypothetical protein D1007_60673 [Hordeum vulgare]